MPALDRQFSSWLKGIAFELDFWDSWFRTKGREWPEDYARRVQRTREAEAWFLNPRSAPPRLIRVLIRLFGRVPKPWSLRILDVGAGPISVLAPYYRGLPLNITAVDPLAPFYAEFAKRYRVKRPIETQQGSAEDLTAYFPLESFDIVHCQNALDHSFDPVRGIEEMLLVTKMGGRLGLVHNRNEAETENYQGFHQWNFDVRDEHFIIWNRETEVDVSATFAAYSDIKAFRTGETVSVFFKKRRKMRVDLSKRHQERVRDLLAAALSAFAAK